MKACFCLAVILLLVFLGCAPVNHRDSRELSTRPSYYEYETDYEWYKAPQLREFQ
jgi:hypothetical protein